MMHVLYLATVALSCGISVAQVNLYLVNEQTCPGPGDDLTFYCNTTEAGILLWNLVNLPGVTGATTNQFEKTLASTLQRITSPDTLIGPNPSIITILNVTAADNGVTVQCGILDGASSELTAIYIRPPECSVTVNATGVTSTSITVRLMWTNCAGAEPSSTSLMWSSVEDPDTATTRVINTQSILGGLEPNTTYHITATFSDACGSISGVIVTATPPQLASPSTVLTSCTESITAGHSGTIAGVSVGCLVLALLSSVTTGVITFLCTRRCYNNKNTSPSSDDKDVYYETVQSDSVQMQPSPAYQSVEQVK